MPIEMNTLMLCAYMVTAFLGAAMVFYNLTEKTYAGFRHWALGTAVVSGGYLFFLMRGLIPLWGSILLVNTCFVLGSIMRLDGVERFVRGRALARAYYAAPLIIAAVNGWFYLVRDSIVLRSFFLALMLCLICLRIAHALHRHAPEDSAPLYRITAACFTLLGLELLFRSLLWLLQPEATMLDARLYHVAHYLFIILMEIAWAISYLMMNSQRLRRELAQSHDRLRGTVTDLEKALSEIKTLRGFLPICSSCKKIRDDRGYWNQIECYIRKHTEAEFSHSICPECVTRLYPDHR